MKNNVILISLITLAFAGSAFAQDIEHDDMYFNSKDRAKLRASQKADELAIASIRKKQREEDEEVNPTDSYSARNVNPEFTSRSRSQVAKADDEDYFVNNYQFNRSSNYNNFNNNFNNWYNGGWYRSNFWGPSIYAWNSPYYGFYDSWNSPWYDPYYNYNGYSSAFSYYYGPSYNYGWGGMYNYWNRPFYSGNSYYGYGAGFGYASNWYWNNYRPTYVVINNNTGDNGRDIVHGRRPTRSTYYATQNNETRTRTTVGSYTRDDNSSGRTRTDYYNNTWRYNSSGSGNNNSGSYDSRSQTQHNRSSSWGNNDSNSSWGNSSRSSSNSSYDGGGTRSHSSYTPSSGGSNSGGGGSNGRSRRD